MSMYTFTASLFVILQLHATALAKPASITVSHHGSMLKDARKPIVRRVQAPVDASILQLSPATGLNHSSGYFSSGKVHAHICPDGSSRVDEVHVCGKFNAARGASNGAAVETLRSTELPHGCFTQNDKVYFNELSGLCKSPAGMCPPFQLVCEKLEDDVAMARFKKTLGACHCDASSKKKELEKQQHSIAQCAVLCGSVDHCDAFEVEENFASPGRCTIYTGSCEYQEEADDADFPMECYLLKNKDELTQISSASTVGEASQVVDDGAIHIKSVTHMYNTGNDHIEQPKQPREGSSNLSPVAGTSKGSTIIAPAAGTPAGKPVVWQATSTR